MVASTLSFLRKSWRPLFLVCVPFSLLPMPLALGTQEAWCAFVMMWMALYWMTEALPLPVTSFMPVLLFPLMGILSSEETAKAYLNDIGIMIVCALIIAGAVETSNLHKRIALKSLLVIGTSNLKLLLGFMLVTMFLSMWIPNTASTSIMAPIVMAVVDQMRAMKDTANEEIEKSLSAYRPGWKHHLVVPHRDEMEGRRSWRFLRPIPAWSKSPSVIPELAGGGATAAVRFEGCPACMAAFLPLNLGASRSCNVRDLLCGAQTSSRSSLRCCSFRRNVCYA